ncbi:MAG: hypothetical protein Kow00122_14750 [Thermoleophilia bacterium]
MNPLRPESADLLREIVNIGASQSSGVLAARVGRPVRISVPVLRELELQEAAEVFGPPADPVEAIFCIASGTFQAGLLLGLPEAEGRRLRNALGIDETDQEGLEAPLAEVLRIFFEAAATFLMAELEPEVSRRVYDMAGSLLPSLIAELEYDIESLWLAEVDFVTQETSVFGRLFFLADGAFYALIDRMAG